jgi:transposase
VAQHQSEIDSGKIVVLFEDECHLLWGDVCGFTWGKRNQAIEVPLTNQKYRQTYYGAVNFQTQAFHLKSFSSGNGENTVAYIKWLRDIYPDARLWLIWDGATYHRYAQMQDYLTEVNANLSEDQWLVTCVLFAPNAPQQNPVEDIWLKGKNWLRKRFAYNKTFADVKDCFFHYLHNRVFSSAKYDWYKACPQII